MFGDGPTSWQSHVVLPKEWYAKANPIMYAEQDVLNRMDEQDLTPTSRLATEVILTKDLDGMIVYVPDPAPAE